MLRRSTILATTALTLSVVAITGAAFASTKTVTDDRGDAQQRFDIAKVRFNNSDTRLSATARVPHLRYGGEQYFSLTFSPRNSPDIFFTAFTKLHADDTLTNRLTVFNDIGEVSRIDCRVGASWSPESHRVKVSAPRSCIEGLTGPQFMAAHLGPNAHRAQQDHVLGHFVRQGEH